NHRQPALLCSHRGLHDDRTDPTGRNYDERVVRSKMEAAKNLLRVTFVILQVQWRPQSVGPYDRRMIGKRQLHQGHKTGITSLPWRHFLAHHAGMPVAEKKHQTAARDSFRAKLGRPLNHGRLRAPELLQEAHSTIEERQSRIAGCAGRRWTIQRETAPFRIPPRLSTPGPLGWHRVRIMHN